ncbi:MAG: GntR family transcriptional regulator [Chloroflexi bacterium]|nr:GntR family transcriptional regulator [Chloroflexota bacterium]
MPNKPLNRNSFEPLYFQLTEKIKVMIQQQFKPGDLLPSETDLIVRYNVSRNTVRQAIEVLEQQGFVISRQGKGTFVASNGSRYELAKLVSFSEDMRQRGLKPDTRLLGLAQVTPPPDVASELNIQPGMQTHEIRRLRLADGEPMAISTAYIPCTLLPGLTGDVIAAGSLFELLSTHLELRISYADRSLSPALATVEQAELLKIPAGSALMLVKGPAFLENDEPVEYVITYYRGDRYDFMFHAVRNP